MCKLLIIETHQTTTQDAGYIERLEAAHNELKAAHSSELRKAKGDARYINELFHRARTAEAQVGELSRQNIALAAQAEQAELLERQLAAADQKIRELEAALRLAQMPADSQSNVIDLLKRTAA